MSQQKKGLTFTVVNVAQGISNAIRTRRSENLDKSLIMQFAQVPDRRRKVIAEHAFRKPFQKRSYRFKP